MQKETFVLDGRTFTRYPDAEARNMRTYWCTYIKRRAVTLHRYLWEREHGPIPAGYVVHHKDLDSSNNVLSNLELLPRGRHQALHASQPTERQKEASRKAAEFTRAWHGTPEGIRWHSEHARQAAAKREPQPATCRQCGKVFMTLCSNGRAAFCSNHCSYRWHREKRMLTTGEPHGICL